jgi:hypothetical protein
VASRACGVLAGMVECVYGLAAEVGDAILLISAALSASFMRAAVPAPEPASPATRFSGVHNRFSLLCVESRLSKYSSLGLRKIR